MSVIVKGLHMPSSCEYCPLCRLYFENGRVWCNGTNRILVNKWENPNFTHLDIPKPEWCPLAEVRAPHGRLIDAARLEERFIEAQMMREAEEIDFSCAFVHNGEMCAEWYTVEDMLDNTPTILDAEEE